MLIKLRKAQSTLEYALVIACIVAALVTMQIYLKRGMQGKMRQSADSIGEQYAPENTTSDMTINFSSNSTTTTNTVEINDPTTNTTTTTTTTVVDVPLETQTRTGSETVGPIQ